MNSRPRLFVLQRDEDNTGVSGTGVVAEGIEFSDGTVALRWMVSGKGAGNPTSVVFHGVYDPATGMNHGIESVEAVHGHEGRTRVVFLD